MSMDVGSLVYEMLDDCNADCVEECKKKIEALKAEIARLKVEKLYLLNQLNEKEEKLKKCREKLEN